MIVLHNRFRGTYLVDHESGAALHTVEQEAAADVDVHNQVGDGPVRFRHDPRLVLSTRVYLTQEQVLCSTARCTVTLSNAMRWAVSLGDVVPARCHG
jgi:hypothetical protein